MWHIDDKPKDECGVVGMWGVEEAAKLAYLGLYSLQHRGQESAGIVTLHEDQLYGYRGMGLVNDVFKDEQIFTRLPGHSAIGHVRYSTTGTSKLRNAQPIQVDYKRGGFAIAHNGNLVNAASLRRELEFKGSIFQSTSDSEVIIQLLAQSPEKFLPALTQALNLIQGAYSLVMLDRRGLVAVRDPQGFRPLVLGKLGAGWVVASETCAFDLLGAEFVREVEPGEILLIDEEVKSLRFVEKPQKQALCVFELVYFSRPDSVVFGEEVNAARIKLGGELAKESPVEADLIVPVPDSSNPAAIGFSRESGIPYEMGLIRSHYIGRTFIEPTRHIRNFGAKLKYNPLPQTLKGKRVVLVDDSIVRGTTCKKIVAMIRRAGAKEVHMRISCPPWIAPCNYGIDTPTAEELLANQHERNVEKMRKEIGLDSLAFLSKEGMIRACGSNEFCTACFDGNYPVKFDLRREKESMEATKGYDDLISR